MERASSFHRESMSHFKFLIILCLLAYPLLKVDAQVNISGLDVSPVFRKPTTKNKEGIFKSQKIKGRISGRGMYLFRNGDIFYGDIQEKAFNGYGAIISHDSIANCPNCNVFVGKFKNNQKNGIGRCYNTNGELIYQGQFIDDKPSEVYPMTEFYGMELPYFTSIQGENLTFIGEFIGDTPNGFSLLIYKSGDIYISKFEEGSPNGIGVYIQANGEWFSEKNNGVESTLISSSEEYSRLSHQAKENFRNSLSVSLGYLAQGLQSGAQFADQMSILSHKNTLLVLFKGSSEESERKESTSYTKATKESSESDHYYDLSEQQAYNMDKSTYHKYDGLLSKVFSGNTRASIDEIRDWQEKMKRIRQKWEKRGKTFPHFANEDKLFD